MILPSVPRCRGYHANYFFSGVCDSRGSVDYKMMEIRVRYDHADEVSRVLGREVRVEESITDMYRRVWVTEREYQQLLAFWRENAS
jgi:hypothetical protein